MRLNASAEDEINRFQCSIVAKATAIRQSYKYRTEKRSVCCNSTGVITEDSTLAIRLKKQQTLSTTLGYPPVCLFVRKMKQLVHLINVSYKSSFEFVVWKKAKVFINFFNRRKHFHIPSLTYYSRLKRSENILVKLSGKGNAKLFISQRMTAEE